MKQLGVVTHAEGAYAVVAVRRMSACSGCHKADPGMDTEGYSSCHECSMFPVDTELTVQTRNDAGAEVGDRVAVETANQTVLGYAASVFLLPLVLAFVGGILFSLLGEQVWLPYLGAILGFVGAFVFVKLVIDRYAEKKTVYTVVKIIKKGNRKEQDG